MIFVFVIAKTSFLYAIFCTPTYQKHGLCQELVPKPVSFLRYHPQDHITTCTGPVLVFLILFVPPRVRCRNCMREISYFEYEGIVPIFVLPVQLSFPLIFM